jgi:hypothetical protein
MNWASRLRRMTSSSAIRRQADPQLAAGFALDDHGQKRSLYSLRHTYVPFRLHENVNQCLPRNMDTSVQMLETFYGHTTNRAMATELTKNKGRQKKSLLWEWLTTEPTKSNCASTPATYRNRGRWRGICRMLEVDQSAESIYSVWHNNMIWR